MSVSRSVIADALGIEESEVKCENCAHGKRWINNAFMCDFWSYRGFLKNEAFCSFFLCGRRTANDR